MTQDGPRSRTESQRQAPRPREPAKIAFHLRPFGFLAIPRHSSEDCNQHANNGDVKARHFQASMVWIQWDKKAKAICKGKDETRQRCWSPYFVTEVTSGRMLLRKLKVSVSGLADGWRLGIASFRFSNGRICRFFLIETFPGQAE